jgi:hypothetical protein
VEVSNGFEKLAPVKEGAWKEMPAWRILFEPESRDEEMAEHAINNSLRRLPGMLNGLV